MNELALALSYYNSPMMLVEQINHWQKYPDELCDRVKVILVDDGSMTFPAEEVIKNNHTKISVELYRITKDIYQNIFGVRNLAFHIAAIEKIKWVLCLDIDHVLPSDGLSGFEELKSSLSTSYFYFPDRYMRQSSGMVPIAKHLDTFLISPDLYWRTGGYDEDMTGYYYNGASLRFRNTLSQVSQGIDISKVYTIFYPTSVIDDASPLRDQEKKTFQGKIDKGKKPSVLNFQWERII